MKNDGPRSGRPPVLTDEEMRNLKTGMRRLFTPVRDDDFRELLDAIDKAAEKAKRKP